MTLVLRPLRVRAGFDAAWEWRQFQAANSRRAQLNSRDMARVEHIPPGHHNVAAGYEVDSEKPNHDGEYSHKTIVGQE